MLDIKSHSPFAAAADMMRAYALATARAASASVVQGMSFWLRMLIVPAPRPSPEAPVEASADAAFASYRSSSGHAVAQVIVPDAPL